MTISTGQRRHHFKNHVPRDPAIAPFGIWPPYNQNFHTGFYQWLKEGGYGPTALNTYLVAARIALGYLKKAFWQIDPESDLQTVRIYLQTTSLTPSTQREYSKGLTKLEEYLRLRQNHEVFSRPVNWTYYLVGLSELFAESVRDYVAHCQRGWQPEDRQRRTVETLSRLCRTLRGMIGSSESIEPQDLTPAHWFDFLERRLADDIHPNTLNAQLGTLKAFLRFVDEEGQKICARTLLIEPLKTGPRLPRDVPTTHLRRLLEAIELEAEAEHTKQRLGILDRAWVHLMLFSGLRTCEVRRLRIDDVNWEARRIRVEQSKGLKDRLVYLNLPTLDALHAWLNVREESEHQSNHIFLYRHRPLGSRFCQERLRTYSKRTGFHITPHQLRHSCATLLLNAGAPIVTVQTLLGHEKIDTTLGYARLYDGTVAADYFRAMGTVEKLMSVSENSGAHRQNSNELVALVDVLGNATLNPDQRETLELLRVGILALTEVE